MNAAGYQQLASVVGSAEGDGESAATTAAHRSVQTRRPRARRLLCHGVVLLACGAALAPLLLGPQAWLEVTLGMPAAGGRAAGVVLV
eukprot:SAG11_NODE_6664_length_1271_cov_1.338737_2_plen_87_part_00